MLNAVFVKRAKVAGWSQNMRMIFCQKVQSAQHFPFSISQDIRLPSYFVTIYAAGSIIHCRNKKNCDFAGWPFCPGPGEKKLSSYFICQRFEQLAAILPCFFLL